MTGGESFSHKSRWDDRGKLLKLASNAMLALANEPTGDRPWRGELFLVAICDRSINVTEVNQNYNAGSG